MISHKSIKNFLYVNLALISLSYFQYTLLSRNYNIFIIFFIFLLRNIFMERSINFISSNKDFLGNIDRNNIKHDIKKMIFFYISSTLIETITHNLIVNFYIYNKSNIVNDIIYFIPISFIYEVIFDLFHYITHRLAHSNSILYKYVHKVHHTHQYVTSITTYYHHPLDLLFTNTLPQILTMIIMPKMSYITYNFIIIYKIFIEISGHTGKKMKTSSFPQFYWLPKILGIQLNTEDHDNHHKMINYNYSKRFKLWDIIFGTYKPPYV